MTLSFSPSEAVERSSNALPESPSSELESTEWGTAITLVFVFALLLGVLRTDSSSGLRLLKLS